MKITPELEEFMKANVPQRAVTEKANARFEESYNMLGVQQEPVRRRFNFKRMCVIAAACAVVACAGTVVFAEYLPAIGRAITASADSYKSGNARGKYVAGTNAGTYPVQAVLAQVESNGYKLTAESAFCDGSILTFSWNLQAPSEIEGLYEYLYLPGAVITVNGVEAEIKQALLYPEAGTAFKGTVVATLAQPLENGTAAEVSVNIPNMEGSLKAAKSDAQTIDASFALHFTVMADTSVNKGFAVESEEANGVKIEAVTASPLQLRLDVALPAGDTDVDRRVPALYQEDGTSLQFLLSPSTDLGYDPWTGAAHTAPLLFDGTPAGTEKVVFRLYKDETQNSVIAEFTVNLVTGEVVPSESYNAEGALNLNDPFNYSYISSPYEAYGEYTNDFSVDDMVYSLFRSQIGIGLRTPGPYREIKVEVFTADGNSIGSTVSEYGTEYGKDNWFWDESSPLWAGYSEARGGSDVPHAYQVYVTPEGYQPAWNETLTIRVTDNETGEEILSKELTFTERSFS